MFIYGIILFLGCITCISALDCLYDEYTDPTNNKCISKAFKIDRYHLQNVIVEA